MPIARSRAARDALRALALVALASSACVKRAPPPDLSPDPVELLAQVERTQARVDRVGGEARVRLESPRGGGTATQFVAAERPDRLRLELLDFFGNPAAVLVADGGRFSLLDLRAGVFYRGAATPQNIGRLVSLPIPAGDLVLILCGAVPIASGRAVAVEPGDGVLRLTVEGADRRQRLDVGAGAAVVSSTTEPLPGVPLPAGTYSVAFDRFRDRAGRPFPGQVRVESRAAGVKLRLDWKEIEVNGVLPEGSFALAPPKGVRIVDLDLEP